MDRLGPTGLQILVILIALCAGLAVEAQVAGAAAGEPGTHSGQFSMAIHSGAHSDKRAGAGTKKAGPRRNGVEAAPQSVPDPGPPILQDIAWAPGDSTVELVLTFSAVPVRYSAYAISSPDRIVMDCHGTTVEALLDSSALPLPVTRAELSTVGDEDSGETLLRLVLFTKKAVAYRVDETSTRLRLCMSWNARLEAQKARQERRRKAWLVGGLSGGALIAGGAVTAGILFGGRNEAEPTLVPPPDMGTPDGN